MADEVQRMERRKARADSVQISGTAFRSIAALATAGVLALGGTFYRVASSVESIAIKIKHIEEVNEKRLSRLERLQEEHGKKSAHDLAEYRISDVMSRCSRIETFIDKCKEANNRNTEGSR